MSGRDQLEAFAAGALVPQAGHRLGELVALTENGQAAFVRDLSRPGQPLLKARTVVDLHEGHMGGQVLFTEAAIGTETCAVVLGVLRGSVLPKALAHDEEAAGPLTVDVDVDGERVVVEAQHQLVLRCGKASITLTEAGKVLIDGTYIVSRSSGVHRIKGGSVQLN